jgi:hypothetical protein
VQAFEEYRNKDASFWALIRFVSEGMGYTHRGRGMVKSFSSNEIMSFCSTHGISINEQTAYLAAQYSIKRASLLNDIAQHMLMDAATAEAEFQKLLPYHKKYGYTCKLPLNKQKGDMKKIAFYTAIINILAEKTIRECLHIKQQGFDDDPRGLLYIKDDNNNLIGSSSRRFDGAFPNILSPVMVWEIKEYYYATTFGSRVADGVYETQLDGYEFQELYNRTGKKIYHVLFVDAYRTWWIQGKSYLCRLVDAMNAGLVDEVIVGKEVFARWPKLLKAIIK